MTITSDLVSSLPGEGTHLRHIASEQDLRESYDRLWTQDVMREEPSYYRWILDLLGIVPAPLDPKGRPVFTEPPLLSAPRILDIACGGGYFLREALAAGLQTWGVDISGVAVARSSSLVPFANIAQASAEALPFPDAFFDYLTCLGSMEHFLNPIAAITEMRRVLKPDGRLIVVLPNQWALPDLLRGILEGEPMLQGQEQERYYALNEARYLLETEGKLHVSAIHGYNTPYSVLRLIRPLNHHPRLNRLYLALYRRFYRQIPLTTSYVFVFVLAKLPSRAPTLLRPNDPTFGSFLLGGWHAYDGGLARWTTRDAEGFLQIPRGSSTVRLAFHCYTPASSSNPLFVELALDDASLGIFPVSLSPDRQELRWSLPPDWQARTRAAASTVRFTLKLDRTWSPGDTGSIDTRQLGIYVEEIQAC